MLLKYVVSNYKSIAYPIEFSMFPTSDEIDKRLVKTIDTKLSLIHISEPTRPY